MADTPIDIKENDIFELSPELMNLLLRDQTLSTDDCQVNIFWATDNYANKGEGYQYNDQIKLEAITGENGNVIVPRAVKSREQQQQRSRKMAEVFTPSWVCNLQNNYVDKIWFGCEGVFNTEVENTDGTHTWIVNPERISFPEGKRWEDYVLENRIEITCGEAPYLVSRYDTVTGEPISIERRIGLLDRKLRVVSENTESSDEWLEAAESAFQSIYGFEWQGDNIVLAREALLYTFIDYYRAKFGNDPDLNWLKRIANIISWNIWQMDGLKGVIPKSCHKTPKHTNRQLSLFGTEDEEAQKVEWQDCPGCKNKDYHSHNGKRCLIMNWPAGKSLEFVSLIKRNK